MPYCRRQTSSGRPARPSQRLPDQAVLPSVPCLACFALPSFAVAFCLPCFSFDWAARQALAPSARPCLPRQGLARPDAFAFRSGLHLRPGSCFSGLQGLRGPSLLASQGFITTSIRPDLVRLHLARATAWLPLAGPPPLHLVIALTDFFNWTSGFPGFFIWLQTLQDLGRLLSDRA